MAVRQQSHALAREVIDDDEHAEPPSVREYLEIQTRHAQKQMQAYAEQAQELSKMMADAAQKAQPKP